MKKIFTLGLIILFIGCNSTRKVEKAMLSGNYDRAIDMALNQIQKGKDNTKTDEQKLILSQAYKKYEEEQLEQLDFLQQSPEGNEEKIYLILKNLRQTQLAINPVLPLIVDEKTLKIFFEDLSSDLIIAKQNYAEYLYNQGVSHMSQNRTIDYRTAFDIFEQVNRLIPNYKDTNTLIAEAREKGTDYVLVKAFNETEVVIPSALEQDILDINTYGLNDDWTVYHANVGDGEAYQFQINLNFESIIFSPERIIEKEKEVQQNIQVSENQVNREGEVRRDSLGNILTYTRNITVSGVLNTINQEKSVSIFAQVNYLDLHNNQKINDYKLDSQFLFQNIFATFQGDERALNSDQKRLLQGQAVPFPANEQMLFDAAEDLKLKLKAILERHKIRPS
jgi:hypothetical protein